MILMLKLNRDSIGQYISKKRMFIRTLTLLVFISGIAYGLSEIAVRINDWSYKHEIQKPIVILTGQGDSIVNIIKRPVVTDRKPLQVLSPIVQQVVSEINYDELNSIEKMICDKWGLYDCKVAIAIAKSESGLREQAWNANNNGTLDLGVFQVNSVHWDKDGCSMKELLDAKKNIDCAYSIYEAQGWHPWVVYQTGSFVGNL